MRDADTMLPEPERDPAVAAALRARFGDPAGHPPLGLETRLMAEARRRIGRRADTWWSYVAAWSRPAIPAGLAATLLLGVALLFGGGAGSEGPAGPEEVLASAAGDALGDLMGDADLIVTSVLEDSAR